MMREFFYKQDIVKQPLELDRIVDLILSFGKTDGEREVLQRLVDNPAIIDQLITQYYLYTPDEVRNTDDWINFIISWERHRK